jgi:lambda family phage portal protein
MATSRNQGYIGKAVANLTGWFGSLTNRINSASYVGATGESMNAALEAERPVLTPRIELEYRNNPVLQGVVNSYAARMVGQAGPQVRVVTQETDYANKLESIWGRWWNEYCDFEGREHGPDKLRMWLGPLLWNHGDIFEQYVTANPMVPIDLPSLRLKSVHPNRVKNPGVGGLDPYMQEGVEIDATGRVIRYHVGDPIDDALSFATTAIPAADMLHYYEPAEPGQLRGAPLAACALQTITDLRDLDKHVLESMKIAATLGGAVLESPNNGGEFSPEPVDLSTWTKWEIKTGSMTAAPVGYSIKQLKPEQPGVNHVEYRDERLREIGRARNIPLLNIKADSAGYNYSSMRWTDGEYEQSLMFDRGKIERKILNVIFARFFAECVNMGLIGPRPKDMKVQWVWSKKPNVDPQKEANGQATELENGLTTLHRACAERGIDYDQLVSELQAEIEQVESMGGVHPFLRSTVPAEQIPEDDGDDAPKKGKEDD